MLEFMGKTYAEDLFKLGSRARSGLGSHSVHITVNRHRDIVVIYQCCADACRYKFIHLKADEYVPVHINVLGIMKIVAEKIGGFSSTGSRPRLIAIARGAGSPEAASPKR